MLLEGTHEFVLNMNDTFAFACADTEKMDSTDFEQMVPLLEEHGRHALTAYAAVKRGQEPIHCKCGHDREDYQTAKGKILAIQKEDPDFCRREEF